MGLTAFAMLLSSSCKLEDNKLQATIYPENGSTNVSVSTIIEVQYPKELGLKDEQMKSGLFSVHECTVNSFDYMMPQKKQTTHPATDPAAAPSEETSASNDPNTSTENKSSNAETKFKSQIKFFHMHRQDASKTIFNYLVISPDGGETPLKPGTTYCVQTKKIKNEKGETIGPKEISFTTEDTPSMTFDSKINPEIFGKRLAMTSKDEATNQYLRDFILVNFRNQAVNPTLIKSQIKLCLASEQMVSSSDECKDFGKEIASDIYLIEGLQGQGENKEIYANYSLFAVAPRVMLKESDQIKIVVNLDVDKDGEANVGRREEILEVDNDSTLSWYHEYMNEIIGENGKPIASPNNRFFYIGSGS
jgi:hypothetical protein